MRGLAPLPSGACPPSCACIFFVPRATRFNKSIQLFQDSPCLTFRSHFAILKEGQGMKDLIPTERIEQAIFLIRGQKVILDDDLLCPS